MVQSLKRKRKCPIYSSSSESSDQESTIEYDESEDDYDPTNSSLPENTGKIEI